MNPSHGEEAKWTVPNDLMKVWGACDAVPGFTVIVSHSTAHCPTLAPASPLQPSP
jgi:hypothetical protein